MTSKKVGVSLLLRVLFVSVENVSTNCNNATTLITFVKKNTFPIQKHINPPAILCAIKKLAVGLFMKGPFHHCVDDGHR